MMIASAIHLATHSAPRARQRIDATNFRAPAQEQLSPWSAGAVLLAIGVVFSISGAAVLTACVLGSNVTQLADGEGFLSTPTETFTTQSYALSSPTMGEITIHPAG